MSLESLLIWRCAPVLAGIKPASLVAVSKKDFPNAQNEIACLSESQRGNGVSFVTVCRCSEKVLVYVYRKDLLFSILLRKDVCDWLLLFGYKTDMTAEEKLGLLFLRLGCNCSVFPHEIGVFLGYPLEDVKGFVENGGQGAKYSGYWKVYSDEKGAIKMFDEYKRCFLKSESLACLGVSFSEACELLSA